MVDDFTVINHDGRRAAVQIAGIDRTVFQHDIDDILHGRTEGVDAAAVQNKQQQGTVSTLAERCARIDAAAEILLLNLAVDDQGGCKPVVGNKADCPLDTLFDRGIAAHGADMKNPVVAAPTYKGYFGARFMQGKWSASAGLQQVCGLYKAVAENEEKETFSLLNLTIDYQLAPTFKLWIKGDNLLAQQYEINAGYPMPKATFMAGFSLDF